jgi:CHAT domain-containing protein
MATSEVIGKFYEGLQAGKDPSNALHAARATVRATEAGRAPAAWAGWLIFAGR